MRIGIVSDIHEAVGSLGTALARFQAQRVDQVVTLGDAFETYEPGGPAAQVAALLRDAGAIGVWGNHDFGLSRDILDEVIDTADPELLRFAAGLEPQVCVGGCHFSHIEHRLDPRKLADLWHFEGIPKTIPPRRGDRE